MPISPTIDGLGMTNDWGLVEGQLDTFLFEKIEPTTISIKRLLHSETCRTAYEGSSALTDRSEVSQYRSPGKASSKNAPRSTTGYVCPRNIEN